MIKAAHETRDRLWQVGLASFCRTTGGKGLHVVVPLTPEVDWSVAKLFCRAFAEAMAKEHPTRFGAPENSQSAWPHPDRLAPQWFGRNGCRKLLTAGSTRCDRSNSGHVG